MSESAKHFQSPSILIFDSGVGGLSVLREVKHRLPNANLTFACDNAAFPYGTLSESALMRRVLNVVRELIEEIKPDIVIIACNTASTLVLDELRSQFDIPFVGVVPAIKPAAMLSKTKVVGLLATSATIERNYTEALISDFAPGCEVLRIGSSELVYMAEQKLRGVDADISSLKRLLSPFAKHKELDTIVLACTHFPLLLDELKPLLPNHINWVDSGAAIARRVESLLTPAPVSQNGKKTQQTYRALMTATDKQLEGVSHKLPTLGLSSFELFSV